MALFAAFLGTTIIREVTVRGARGYKGPPRCLRRLAYPRPPVRAHTLTELRLNPWWPGVLAATLVSLLRRQNKVVSINVESARGGFMACVWR